MHRTTRTLRALALALVSAALALFRTPIRLPLAEMPREWRRAFGIRLLRAHGYAPIAGGATLVGSRNPLFYRNIPGGLPAIIDTSKFSGNVFYVDSAASGGGDTTGHGSTPDKPHLTIDYAIGRCTASQGDVILVLPGHAESINTAGGITCDIAGVSIIGLGRGNKRPTVTVGTSLDTSTVLVSAADVVLQNLIFVPGNDGVDVLVDIDADGCIVEDCEFRSDETNAYQADTYIDINGGANGADRTVIRRCRISSITAGANQAIEIGAVQDALVIEDCWIVGDFAVAGIHSGSITTNGLIARNFVHNVNAGDWCIEFTDAATGLLVGNRFYANAAATTLDPGSMACVDNLMVNAIDQTSTPVPTTAGGVLPTGTIGAASFAAGAIDAAAIAANAIDAATFAADALQAMQDEAEDALEGENLDHLAATTTVAADMTAEVVDGSVISRILSKTSDTSSYSPTTDALEMLSDKLGAFSGDGGAAADDSIKALADLIKTAVDAILVDTGTDGVVLGADSITAAKIADNAIAAEHIAAAAIDAATFAADALQAFQDEAEDALEGENLDHLLQLDGATQVYPEQAVADSIIAKIIAKGDPATPSTYSCVTDSLEALSDKAGAFSGDGGAAQDDSVKASLDLAHTDLDAILADTGTDGVVIGADAITAAKIADNAFAKEHFALSAGERTTDGIVVTRAAGVLPQTTSVAIFTVSGGHVLLKRIMGLVTVQIGAVANVTHLRVNSTGAGATTDICLAAGGLDVTGDVVDTLYQITGTFGDAMVATTNLPIAKAQVTEIVVPPGTIELVCGGSDGGGGQVRWSVTYVPMEATAQIVAA